MNSEKDNSPQTEGQRCSARILENSSSGKESGIRTRSIFETTYSRGVQEKGRE